MARFASQLRPRRALAQALALGLLVWTGLAVAAEAEMPEPLPSLDELLDRGVEGDYANSKRCLSLHKFSEVKALDEHHIVFELHGDRFYLVQLERRCPGLKPQNAVAYEHRSARLCQMDRVSGVGVTGGFSPSCQLGRFQPVTEEQIALLEEALKQREAHGKHRGKPLKDPEPAVTDS